MSNNGKETLVFAGTLEMEGSGSGWTARVKAAYGPHFWGWSEDSEEEAIRSLARQLRLVCRDLEAEAARREELKLEDAE